MSLPVCTPRSARPRPLPATAALLSAPQQSRKSSGRCLAMVLPWRLASQTPAIKNRLLYVHREQGGRERERGSGVWSFSRFEDGGEGGSLNRRRRERWKERERERLAEFSL